MSSTKKVINMVVDHEQKVLIPKNLEEFYYILSFFEDKSSVTVTVEPFLRPVELSQMRLLHAYIKEISEYTGQSSEDIKIHLKKEFGVKMEDGSLKSTSHYTTKEMGKLIDGCYLFMVEDLSMIVPTPESFKNKNIK